MNVRFLLLAIGLIFNFNSVLKAQIFNSEILFFVSEDSQLRFSGEEVLIYKFQNGTFYYLPGQHRLGIVAENLKRDSNFYEKQSFSKYTQHIDQNHYNSKVSNSKWEVYSETSGGWSGFWGVDGWVEGVPAGTSFWAFKKDLSSFMRWREPDSFGEGRKTLKRISKSNLINLDFNKRDFLN